MRIKRYMRPLSEAAKLSENYFQPALDSWTFEINQKTPHASDLQPPQINLKMADVKEMQFP